MSPDERKVKKAAYDRERRARLKDEIAAKKREYYLRNKDRENERVAKWCEENKARSLEIKRAWQERNRTEPAPRTRMSEAEYRARAVARVARWREANPDKYRAQLGRAGYRPRTPAQKAMHAAYQSLRERGMRHARPAWANQAEIRRIYLQAQAEGKHVDHVIPLRHPQVCGLHVPANLRPLPPSENCRKGNRIDLEALNAHQH